MDKIPLNTFDLIFIGVVLLWGLQAFFRGFVREVFTLGSWIGASYVSTRFYSSARPFVGTYIENRHMADVATGLGLFCLTLILLIPIGIGIKRMVKGQTLSAIDRSLGFVFGLVTGWVAFSLLFFGLTLIWPTPTERPDWLAKAKTTPVLAFGADIAKSMIPQEDQAKLFGFIDENRRAQDKIEGGLDAMNSDIVRSGLGKQQKNEVQPVPEPKPVPQPSAQPQEKPRAPKNSSPYNPETRYKLDKLIEEKGKAETAP